MKTTTQSFAVLVALFVELGLCATGCTRTEAERLEHDCTRGILGQCNNLGRRLSDGKGVPRDDERAARLFRKACDGDLNTACSNLGVLYASGPMRCLIAPARAVCRRLVIRGGVKIRERVPHH